MSPPSRPFLRELTAGNLRVVRIRLCYRRQCDGLRFLVELLQRDIFVLFDPETLAIGLRDNHQHEGKGIVVANEIHNRLVLRGRVIDLHEIVADSGRMDVTRNENQSKNRTSQLVSIQQKSNHCRT